MIHIYNELLLSHKRNKLDLVLVRSMNLEPVIQSEVSRKEKNKYSILMATHSSVLAWRIPGTGEPGGLPSMGSHRVGHD